MKINKKFTWILFLPLLLSCGLFSIPTTSFSARSYIEGLWVPSKYTLDFMNQSGYELTQHSIEFLPDGTVVMTNIPLSWLFDQETSSLGFFSGNGTWLLSEQMVNNVDDIGSTVQISGNDGLEASIKFDAVLELIGFVPANKPKEVNWVTFQKCYPHLHINDDYLKPLVRALNQSPRDTLGFSPITLKDQIEIDGAVGEEDIWLHAYNDFSSHDIFFRLNNHAYMWVFEQENFTGPEKWVDSDAATWQETIMLQYQIEDINGGPINDLMIDYIGHDQRLINESNYWYLSNDVNDIIPVLDEWRQWRANEPPSPEALCP
jgi:hypothetical protein